MVDEAARFDRLAPAYDRGILLAELVIGRRRKRLLGRAHGRVLEVGIGTGRTLRLYPTDCQITGIDLSAEMLERARKRAHRLGRTAEFRVMSSEKLDFGDSTFDVVVSSLAFCSVEEAGQTLLEIRRVLRPGGELLMIEHVRPPGWLGRLFDRLDPWFYQRSCHLNRRTPEDVRRAGFEMLEEQRWLWGIFACLRAVRPA